MKSAMLASSLVFSALTTMSQGTHKEMERNVGIATSLYFYEKSYKGFVTPYFEIRNHSQAFFIGATILTTSEFDASDRKYPKLNGFESSYKFYPMIPNRKVDFYLHATILFQRIVDRWEVNYWNDSYSFYESSNYKNIETIINPTLGYGISINILKRLKVNQSIGAGYFFSAVNGEKFNNESSEVDHHDYRPYGNNGFAFQVHLGMSYRLGKKQ